MRTEVMRVRMSAAEVARLDELAAARGTTRSGVLRSVLGDGEDRDARAVPPATRERTLAMLAVAAEDGSVTAMVGFARELRLGGTPKPILPAGRVSVSELRVAR